MAVRLLLTPRLAVGVIMVHRASVSIVCPCNHGTRLYRREETTLPSNTSHFILTFASSRVEWTGVYTIVTPLASPYYSNIIIPSVYIYIYIYIYNYRGKFANLEDLSCKIKPGCKDHSPWPAGICTKCQPSAITLARQVL